MVCNVDENGDALQAVLIQEDERIGRLRPGTSSSSLPSGMKGKRRRLGPEITPADDALLRKMTAAIVQVADPEQVILFGSRARGDAGSKSDFDLLVVIAEPSQSARTRHAEEIRIWRALAKFHVPKDILVCTLGEAEHWRDSINHVLARAQREGKILYERF